MKVKKLYNDVKLPTYATTGSAAFDLSAYLKEDMFIHPSETKLIGTGLSFQPDKHHGVFLLPRSGLGHKQGIVLGNLVGLCDGDYRGEYMISCWNRNTEGPAFKVSHGDRIAQAVVMPVIRVEFEEVLSLEETERGRGGFGSSGK